MSRKNSRNLVYVKSKKRFLLLALFLKLDVNTKRVIHAESFYLTPVLNSSLKEGSKICFCIFLKFGHPDC